MATYPGDPRVRPELAVCAISATGSIKCKREELIGKTAVCWLSNNSHYTNTNHVVDALTEQLHIDRREIKVVKHFPEQYLIFFDDPRAYHRVLHYREVRSRGRVFNFDQWTERRGAKISQLEFRVRLRIEGVPVHAWSEEVVANIISPSCAIHYIDGHSRRRDRTRTYDLWAWCANPSKIPKKVLLTVTDPDSDYTTAEEVEQHRNPPRQFKRTYDYKVHIHLDVVEDISFFDGRGGRDGPRNRKPRREFLWNYGEPDSLGERRNGQGHDNHASRNYRPRRDEDDLDDKFSRGMRRHHSQSSWERMTGCRGATDNYYNSSSRSRGGNHGYDGHHSRAEGPSTTATWRPKSTNKKVSFSNPLVQIMERPTREQRIRDMLASAPGWSHIHSPVSSAEPGKDSADHQNDNTNMNNKLTPHLPQPLANTEMAAIQTLIEQGNKPKSKKKSKVVPAPQGAELVDLAG
ncbi:unnamed protein product [Urochloa humidicola]